MRPLIVALTEEEAVYVEESSFMQLTQLATENLRHKESPYAHMSNMTESVRHSKQTHIHTLTS